MKMPEQPIDVVGAAGAALGPRPRSIMWRAPPPIMVRAVANGIGGSPSPANTTLRVSTRSGAVSTSVPSRSKTTVRQAPWGDG